MSKTTAWQAAHLVAGQHAGAIGGAAQDGGHHQQAAVARADEQAHALHLPVAAHAEVRILPARRSSYMGRHHVIWVSGGRGSCTPTQMGRSHLDVVQLNVAALLSHQSGAKGDVEHKQRLDKHPQHTGWP